MDENRARSKWLPALYGTYYCQMKEIARSCGYNLLLHGSMSRDLDLVAIPWIEQASSHQDLLDQLCKGMGFKLDGQAWYNTKEEKPHNRLSYVIMTSEWEDDGEKSKSSYIDISIMKRKSD